MQIKFNIVDYVEDEGGRFFISILIDEKVVTKSFVLLSSQVSDFFKKFTPDELTSDRQQWLDAINELF